MTAEQAPWYTPEPPLPKDPGEAIRQQLTPAPLPEDSGEADERATGFRVRQFLPFDSLSYALEHPAGTPATNGAWCVQIEVCGFAIDHTHHGDWSEAGYDALARLLLMLEHRRPIPPTVPRGFSATPHRFSADEWLTVEGIVGHEHAPNQRHGHWDPGDLNAAKLRHRMRQLEQAEHFQVHHQGEDWLPTGMRHGLRIDHHPTHRSLPMLPGRGHWKAVIHTTEGLGFEAMSNVLVREGFEPHLLLGRP